ncbi:MAG TPA: TolC family protein [Longimicrobiales bacterium]|nr:TolC family protein [Longimicrobiales bacterium]
MEIRNRILDAAVKVFGETGYRGATTRRIAQLADVNEVTLFRHFGSKEELLHEAVQQISSTDDSVALPADPQNPERELTLWARAQHDHLTRHSSVIRTCMAESGEHPEMARCAQHRPMKVAAELRTYLGKLQKKGMADANVDLPSATSFLMGAVFNDAMGRAIMPELFKHTAAQAPAKYVKLFLRAIGAAVIAILVLAGRSHAQGAQQLSLDDAIRVARGQSEQVSIAQAGVMRATGQQLQARSQYMPQLYGSLAYTRTLKSEFSALQDSDSSSTSNNESEDCGTFTPNPALPLPARVDSLERAVECNSNANPFAAFADLPFGREHQFNMGLSFSQNVFAGGRIVAQNRIARAGRRTAEIGLASAEAQLMLDVTEAYYNAALSDRMLAIAEATLQQAETTLSQARLARQVGDKPEFELLRAQVTRDTQQPIVIQRRSDRDVAYMRLKQMLNIPLDRSVALSTSLGDDQLPATVVQASERLALADTVTDVRAPVRQAAEAVNMQESQKKIAAAQRLPSLAISSQYGRVGYPEGFGIPGWNDFRSNWTVTASLQVPLFTGGRIKGDNMVAQANLDEARLRLQQTRELAALDTRHAIERLSSAEASWRASSGTVEQANRAYHIAEIRYKEGISTQLELADSRILLQQAQANRALAARDLQIARARIALLRDLPLNAGGAAQFQTMPSNIQMPQQQQTQPQQQQPQQQRPATGVQTSTVGN